MTKSAAAIANIIKPIEGAVGVAERNARGNALMAEVLPDLRRILGDVSNAAASVDQGAISVLRAFNAAQTLRRRIELPSSCGRWLSFDSGVDLTPSTNTLVSQLELSTLRIAEAYREEIETYRRNVADAKGTVSTISAHMRQSGARLGPDAHEVLAFIGTHAGPESKGITLRQMVFERQASESLVRQDLNALIKGGVVERAALGQFRVTPLGAEFLAATGRLSELVGGREITEAAVALPGRPPEEIRRLFHTTSDNARTVMRLLASVPDLNEMSADELNQRLGWAERRTLANCCTGAQRMGLIDIRWDQDSRPHYRLAPGVRDAISGNGPL